MTTMVDIGVLGIIFAGLHFINFLLFENVESYFWGIALLVIGAVSILHIKEVAEKRHRELSNEQLRLIKNFHKAEVCDLTAQVLQNMPK